MDTGENIASLVSEPFYHLAAGSFFFFLPIQILLFGSIAAFPQPRTVFAEYSPVFAVAWYSPALSNFLFGKSCSFHAYRHFTQTITRGRFVTLRAHHSVGRLCPPTECQHVKSPKVLALLVLLWGHWHNVIGTSQIHEIGNWICPLSFGKTLNHQPLLRTEQLFTWWMISDRLNALYFIPATNKPCCAH